MVLEGGRNVGGEPLGFIVGPQAGTVIPERDLAIEFGASAEDVGHTCHDHSTLNEANREAALAANGMALNI